MATEESIRLKFEAITSDLTVASTRLEAIKAELTDLNDAVARGAPGWEQAKARIKALKDEQAQLGTETTKLAGQQERLGEALLKAQGPYAGMSAQAQQLENELRDAGAAMGGFTAATIANDPALRGKMDQLTTLRSRLNQIDGSLQTTRVGTANYGLALNAAAQGVEDLQYGIGGAMNNLSQFAIMMGAGGAAVAGVTIAGVAVNQVFRRWGDIVGGGEGATGRTKVFSDELDKLKDRLKTLEDKPTKFAVDYTEIDKAKERIDQITKAKQTLDAAMRSQTAQEAASGKTIEEYLTVTVENRQALEQVKQSQEDAVNQDAAVVQARQAKVAADKQMEAATANLNRPHASQGEAMAAADMASRARTVATAAAAEEARAVREAKGRTVDVGQLLLDAQGGNGEKQLDAQKRLADLMARAGGPAGRDIANVIREQAPGNQDRLRQEEEAFVEENTTGIAAGGRAAGRTTARAQAAADREWQAIERQNERDDALVERRRNNRTRDADREADRRAAELAATQGPRFDGRLQSELLQNQARRQQGGGVDDATAAKVLTDKVAEQLGGTADAKAAAEKIVAQQMRQFTQQLTGLLGQGLGEQQALMLMFDQQQGQLMRLQLQLQALQQQGGALRQRQRTQQAWGR